MKRLIVTADDVGLHRGMTEAAVHAHRNGIVTACSIVANGRELDHALDLLRATPTLDTGVHLTLVEERPLSPVETVKTLCNADGTFYKNYVSFFAHYVIERVRMDEVMREFRLQIERVLASGLPIRHLNGHQHLHLFPGVLGVTLRLAEEYRIPFVRTVEEKSRGRSGFMRAAAIKVLSQHGKVARPKIVSRGFRTSDRSIGVADAGHLTVETLLALLEEVGDGTTELVVHPGLGQESLSSAYDWKYDWEIETAALCDPRVKEKVGQLGVELVGTRQGAGG